MAFFCLTFRKFKTCTKQKNECHIDLIYKVLMALKMQRLKEKARVLKVTNLFYTLTVYAY